MTATTTHTALPDYVTSGIAKRLTDLVPSTGGQTAATVAPYTGEVLVDLAGAGCDAVARWSGHECCRRNR